MTFQVAVTNVYCTYATWCESLPGLGDYRPMESDADQFTIFNGKKCRRGNRINDTPNTRVSFYFRIVPLDKYMPDMSKASGTKRMIFIVGEYYKELK
jgi:hypothetical protein